MVAVDRHAAGSCGLELRSRRRSCEFPAAESLQILKVARIGFCSAAGIKNDDSGGSESQQRKAHGHTVVVIGVNAARLWASRVNGETIGMFFGTDPGSLEFGGHGGNAIRFLVPHVADIVDTGG